uniref:Glucagon / GIP / secretin / VIP family domain-containing protein n=1 Tax=Salarias fasciatus TaxID=181472 RepID=A0A672FIT8_SALFA
NYYLKGPRMLRPLCTETHSASELTRHADGLFTSGYSRLLSQMTAKDYLDSLITKRLHDDKIEDQFPVKRHSDAVFTNKYSRFRKQMAAKKYLSFILQGKRRYGIPTDCPESDEPAKTPGSCTDNHAPPCHTHNDDTHVSYHVTHMQRHVTTCHTLSHLTCHAHVT